MSYYEPLVYIVPPEQDGWLLKTIIMRKIHVSRALLARLKKTERGIMLNGTRVYISVKVKAGDVVELRMEQEHSDDILAQPLPLDIVYEDEHVLVVNKMAGMIVHPTVGHYTNTLANAVVFHWEQAGKKHRFRPVHRLDQHTSGAMAIAKTPYVDHILSEQLKQQHIERQYVALVYGAVAGDEGTIDAPIDRDPADPHTRIVTETGYRSVTHYEVMERFGEHMTKVKVWLETGRTHQIRVHMTHIGHPLLGDDVYYTDASHAMSAQLKRQALHAAKLAFTHPITKQRVAFAAPLPDDMREVIEFYATL